MNASTARVDYVRLPENKLAVVHHHANGITEFHFLAQLTDKGLELAVIEARYTLKPQTKPFRVWRWGQAPTPTVNLFIKRHARKAFCELFALTAKVGV